MSRIAHLGMSAENRAKRRGRLGGTDARIIMSGDQYEIERLWHIKRGEMEDDNLDDVLLVQLGNATEALNLHWFEKETGFIVTDDQKHCIDLDWEIAACTLDGLVREYAGGPTIGLMDAKFMFPFNFSIDKAVVKYGPQLQHNMMVTGEDHAWLSVINGAGQYFVAEIPAYDFYQLAQRQALMDFWDCVQTGRTPGIPDVEGPKVEPIRVIDMSDNNAWGDFAATLAETIEGVEKHEYAKKEIKKLFPADAIKADGKGISLSRSKDGKVLMKIEAAEAAKAKVKELYGATQEVKARKPRAKKALITPTPLETEAA